MAKFGLEDFASASSLLISLALAFLIEWFILHSPVIALEKTSAGVHPFFPIMSTVNHSICSSF